MYTIEVKFEILKKGNRETQVDLINSLLGTWRMNGQILGKYFPIALKSDYFVTYLSVPEKNSLISKFSNKYGRKHNLELLSAGLSKPKLAVMGKEPESSNVCRCSDSSSYVLFTTYLSIESPLRCFDCFGVIPLYKISKTYDDEYYNIICWESDYQSCDSLQMNCKVGERFAMNQMLKIDSSLSKQGLEVCKSIEDVTGKQAYYYLCKGSGKTIELEMSRKCPSCNGEWHTKNQLHDMFDFVCKKCNLLSNVAWSLR